MIKAPKGTKAMAICFSIVGNNDDGSYRWSYEFRDVPIIGYTSGDLDPIPEDRYYNDDCYLAPIVAGTDSVLFTLPNSGLGRVVMSRWEFLEAARYYCEVVE